MAEKLGEAFIEFKERGVQRVTRAASKASKALAGLGTAGIAMGAALGAAAVGGMAAMVANSFATVDALAKTSDKLGIATEKLAGLRHAAEQTGVSTRTLDMAIQRMTRRVAEAAQGTGEAVKALQELGLSATALNAMSPDQAFRQIAEAMANVEGQSNRVRLAFKLFDSEGVDLVRTLSLGAEGLDAMQREAEELGLAISRIDAEQIERANDAINNMKGAGEGLASVFAVKVAPAVSGVADAIRLWTTNLDAAKGAAIGFGTALARVLPGVLGMGLEAALPEAPAVPEDDRRRLPRAKREDEMSSAQIRKEAKKAEADAAAKAGKEADDAMKRWWHNRKQEFKRSIQEKEDAVRGAFDKGKKLMDGLKQAGEEQMALNAQAEASAKQLKQAFRSERFGIEQLSSVVQRAASPELKEAQKQSGLLGDVVAAVNNVEAAIEDNAVPAVGV